VTAPSIYKTVGYDPVKDFAPVATIFSSPQVLVVNPAVPANSMRELVAYAKANPGKVSYASPGFGTQPHLLGEMLKLATGADIVHVPFRGSAPALTDLLAGQVQVFFDTTTFLLPHVEAGKLRPLAVADEVRSPQFASVPTTIESGFPKLQGTYWTAVVAPAGTPPDVIGKLNAAINAITTSKEMEETLSRLSAKAKVGSPADVHGLHGRRDQEMG
jgi:tripartite-type tricarboxylate transporter receptor subunit TctC